MRKIKFFFVALALAMLLSCLSGCSNCEHQWKMADCKDPKTCKLCGDTEGEPTDQHKWQEATTEAPKTCSVCGLTEGEKIEVDERFNTKACKDLFGNWVVQYEIDGSNIWAPDMKITMKMTYRFTNEGELIVITEPYDKKAFEEAYAQHLVEMVYTTYEARGEDRAAAEAHYMSTTGMSVQEFCRQRAPEITVSLSDTEERVYFVEDGLLYTGEDWGDTMTSQDFEVTKDGKLKIGNGEPDQTLEFIRVANVIK